MPTRLLSDALSVLLSCRLAAPLPIYFLIRVALPHPSPQDAALLSDELLAGAKAPHTLIARGHRLGAPAPLIAEIPDDVIEGLRQRWVWGEGARRPRAAHCAGEILQTPWQRAAPPAALVACADAATAVVPCESFDVLVQVHGHAHMIACAC
jgi:hypothetical protein